MENEKKIDDRFFIFGSVMKLSNILDTVGNWFLDDITPKQWLFLAVLTTFFTDPPFLKDISDIMGSSHQNVKQIALKLEEKGYIDIYQDLDDRRAKRIAVSQKTYDYEKKNEKKNKEFIDMLFKDFTKEEIKTFKVILEKLESSLKRIERNSEIWKNQQ